MLGTCAAFRCLEDEDLDAIGIINPAHRQMIKGSSQQEEEPPPANEDLDALNFDNVLSDLDTIIGELGAFGNVRVYIYTWILCL